MSTNVCTRSLAAQIREHEILAQPAGMPLDLIIQLAATRFSVIEGLWRINATPSLMVVLSKRRQFFYISDSVL
jgi:hypothetical protein